MLGYTYCRVQNAAARINCPEFEEIRLATRKTVRYRQTEPPSVQGIKA